VYRIKKWADFKDAAEKQMVRGARIFYMIEENGNTTTVKIKVGCVGYVKEFNTANEKEKEELNKIHGWLLRNGGIEVEEVIPDDMFFT